MNEAEKTVADEERKRKRKAWAAAYYLRNKDRIVAQSIKWQKDHPDRVVNKDSIKASSAAYYVKNKDRIKARSAKWQKDNAEQYKAAARKWREANKDKTKAYSDAYMAVSGNRERKYANSARWRKNNTDRMKALAERWTANNLDRVMARRRDYYIKNREKSNAYTKAYLAARPEISRHAANLRRVQKRNGGTLNDPVIKVWDKAWREKNRVRCYWCNGLFGPSKCHADHIVALSKGGMHRIDNLCIACSSCNSRKHNKDVSLWNRQLLSPVLL